MSDIPSGVPHYFGDLLDVDLTDAQPGDSVVLGGDGVWREGVGAGGAFAVKGPFAIAYDTPNIGTAAGVALWTPAVGDIVAGFDVRITTLFDAGFRLQMGAYGVDGNDELLDLAYIGAGADGVDYSQNMGRWMTFLSTATVRARTVDGDNALATPTVGSLTLRAYVISA